MRIIQCTNKHFFDADRYVACPHCGAPAAEGASSQASNLKEEKKSRGLIDILRGHGKKKNEEQPIGGMPVGEIPVQQYAQQPGVGYNPGYAAQPAAPQGYPMAPSTPGYGNMGASANPGYGAPVSSAGSPYGEGTVSLFDNQSNDQPDDQGATESYFSDGSVDSAASAQPVIPNPTPAAPAQVPVGQSVASTENTQPPVVNQETELSKAVRKAVEQNEEKTMSFFSMKVSPEKKVAGQETSGVESTETSSVRRSSGEPVCGWLVAVSGGHFGESFELYSGKNTIGRNQNNRIILNRDPAVSREHHAILVFEPKKRNYFLQPGDSSGLTYLNGDYIMETKQLNRGDFIELGESKLLFVPLCGEDFSWETYIDGEQK